MNSTMRSFYKASAFIAIGMFALSTTAHSQLFETQDQHYIKKHYKEYIMPGCYNTYDDYAKGNLTKEPVVIWNGNLYPLTDGNLGKPEKLKDKNIWGYKDDQGFSWYMLKGTAYRIVVVGKIWVLANGVSYQTDESGKVKSVTLSGGGFDGIVFMKMGSDIASGSATEPTGCSKKNLMKFMEDDVEVTTLVKDKGIYQNRNNKWGESFLDVVNWVSTYNSKHKS